MIFKTGMDLAGNGESHSARQSLNVDANGPKMSQAT